MRFQPRPIGKMTRFRETSPCRPATKLSPKARATSTKTSPLSPAAALIPASPTPRIAAGGFTSLHEFSDALLEIGLIDQAELDSFAADSAEGVLGLSRALVKAGKLTPYQAAAVYQKKSRGLLVGNYVILDKLGQGGMGVVFKCRHRRLGESVLSRSCPLVRARSSGRHALPP